MSEQTQQPEKEFIIPNSLRIALLTYLSNKPHIEVRDGISALENLKEL